LREQLQNQRPSGTTIASAMIAAPVTASTVTSKALVLTWSRPASRLGKAIRSTAPTPSEAPMSRQPRRHVDSPRKLTTRPASTPITTINSGHCRNDLAVALVSRRGTSHQMFGAFNDVAEQHGSGHWPDTTRYRRHPARNLEYARIKITNQAGIGPGNADVDADGARSDHVGSD
jgi:hypothetical protein